VIKFLVVIEKIKREVKILNMVNGHPNIVEFTECVIDPVSRTPSLIFKFLDHHLETKDYLEKISPDDLKIFLINILKVFIYFIFKFKTLKIPL